MQNASAAYYGAEGQSVHAPQHQQERSYNNNNHTGTQQNIVNSPHGQMQLSNALQGMQLAPVQGMDSRRHAGAAPPQNFQHDRQQSYQQGHYDRMRPPLQTEMPEKQWRPSSAVPPTHTTARAGGYRTSVRSVTDQRTQSVARDMAIQTSESVRHADPTACCSRDRLTSEEQKYGVTFRDGVLPKPIWLGSLENAETAKDRMRQ